MRRMDGVSGAPVKRRAKSTAAWHKRLDTIFGGQIARGLLGGGIFLC